MAGENEPELLAMADRVLGYSGSTTFAGTYENSHKLRWNNQGDYGDILRYRTFKEIKAN